MIRRRREVMIGCGRCSDGSLSSDQVQIVRGWLQIYVVAVRPGCILVRPEFHDL